MNVCAQCAKIYPTCCTLSQEKGILFVLSPAEIKQIANYVQKKNFFKTELNSAQLVQSLIAIFPDQKKDIIRIYPPNNYHFTLALKQDKCYFLGEKGCLLPRQIRPFFCRIYPFWVRERRITLFKDNQCLALNQFKTVRELLKIFNISPEQILKLYQNYKQALFKRT